MNKNNNTIIVPENRITRFDISDAAIIELRGRLAMDVNIEQLKSEYGTIETVKDSAGLKKLKTNITVVRTLRTTVDKRRENLKKDALEYGRKIQKEANDIKEQLLKIEEPMKAEQARYEAIKEAERLEKARVEAERIANIQNEIDSIIAVPMALIGESSEEIQVALDELNESDDFDYQELEDRHEIALSQTLSKLEQMLEQAKAQEEKEAAAKERERLAEIERKKQEAEAEENRLRLEKERAEFEAEQKAEKEKLKILEEGYRKERHRQERQARMEREEAAAIERAKLEEQRQEFAEQERIAKVERDRREAEDQAVREQAEERFRKEKAAQDRVNTEREEAAKKEREEIAAEREKVEEEKRRLQRVEQEKLDAEVQENCETRRMKTEIKEDPTEMVTITLREYEQLLIDKRTLLALHSAGVDNWEGYGEAIGGMGDE